MFFDVTDSSTIATGDDAAPLFDGVTTPDHLAAERLRAALGESRRGQSFGRLADVAAQIASWQGQTAPRPLERARVVVFAGDHGIAARDISVFAPQDTVKQADELQGGGGPAQVMARASGASLRVVDVALDRDVWGDERVMRSSGAIDVDDAVDEEQFSRALEIGKRVADQEVDAGADILLPASLGVGVSTVTAALLGSLTRTEPVAVVGPESGLSDEMWKRKVSVIRDAMFRARELRSNVPALLRAVSSADLVALVGFIGQAAVRRTPVLLDGAPETAAALVANRLAPGARDWFLAGQLTPEPAHRIALAELDLAPLIALELSTGQGVGALAALPLVRAAVELAAEELSAHK